MSREKLHKKLKKGDLPVLAWALKGRSDTGRSPFVFSYKESFILSAGTYSVQYAFGCSRGVVAHKESVVGTQLF